MTVPRKFTLINTRGDRLQLSEHRNTGIATINPKGIGVGFTNTLEDYSTAQVIKQRRVKLPDFEIDIVLGMNFADATPREIYLNIVKFLNHAPYTLEYATENGKFFKDVDLLDLPMTDLKESHLIQETLKFTQKTLWYQEIVFVGQDTAADRTDAEGAVLRDGSALETTDPDKLGRGYIMTGKDLRSSGSSPLGQPNPNGVKGYVYSSNKASTGAGGVFDLHNDSIYFGLQNSSPLEISITGRNYANPWWELLDSNGKVLASDAYKTTLTANKQLVVRGGFGRTEAKIVDTTTGGSVPAYQLQDHTKTNFVTAPLGDSQLRFHTTNNATLVASDIKITMRKEYVMVG